MRSAAEPGFLIAIRTSEIENSEAIITIKNVNSKVAGILWLTSSLTGNWEMKEVPKSPLITPPSQFISWTCMG
jgi:hypothetical protein